MNENSFHHWTSDAEKVEAFVLHRLDEKEDQELAAHLEHCDACSLRVQHERELRAGIRRFGRTEFRRRLNRRLRRDRTRHVEWSQVASLAAAVVLMVGAVFAVRWFTEEELGRTRSREIVLNSDKPAERSIWIMGRVLGEKYNSPRSISKSNAALAKKESSNEAIMVRRMPLAGLPPAMRSESGASVRTLLERTTQGIQLTVFSDAFSDSTATGVEVLAPDSIVVFINGSEIAYHIPGGWKRPM